MEPNASFAEFVDEKNREYNKEHGTDGEKWTDALRIHAKVKSPIEERSKEEWEKIFDRMLNEPIKN